MISDDDICVTTMLMMMIMQMIKMENEDGDDDDNEDDDEDDDDGDDDDDDTFAILCYTAGQSSAIFSPQSGKAIKAGHVTASHGATCCAKCAVQKSDTNTPEDRTEAVEGEAMNCCSIVQFHVQAPVPLRDHVHSGQTAVPLQGARASRCAPPRFQPSSASPTSRPETLDRMCT